MEKKIYFIYSNNKKRDENFLKNLHNLLPMNIDIIAGKIKDFYFVDINNREKRKIPFCIIQNERPIYITENTLERLIEIEQLDGILGLNRRVEFVELLKLKYKKFNNFPSKLMENKEIIIGAENIEDYIIELKERGFFSY